jgi:hypothetical protein
LDQRKENPIQGATADRSRYQRETHCAEGEEALQDDLDALKRSVDMIALLTQYGVELKQKGNEYHGLCIWHDDHDPSMQVYVSAKDGHQRAHCKACGRGGTVIDVVMEMDRCDEREAIKRLRVNGFHRDDTRIKAEAPISAATWQHQPAPEDMPDMRHKDYGEPVAVWRYNDADGRCLGYVARYAKPNGGKEYRPWTFGSYSANKLPPYFYFGYLHRLPIGFSFIFIFF